MAGLLDSRPRGLLAGGINLARGLLNPGGFGLAMAPAVQRAAQGMVAPVMQAHQAMPWGGNDPSAIGIDTQAGTIDPSVMVPFATNVAGMATTGSLAAPGVAGGVGMGMKADITRPYPRSWQATVDGKKAGYASMTEAGEAGPYIDIVRVEPEFKRQGIATQLYDQIESDLGRRLIPSPMGLSDEAVAFWNKRLSGLSDAERQEALRLGVEIADQKKVGKFTRDRFKALGFSESDIDYLSSNPKESAALGAAILGGQEKQGVLGRGIRAYHGSPHDPKPVKLPLDSASRQARAATMNFDDRTFYHATSGDFDEFDLGLAGTGANAGARGEKAVFLTDNPAVADDYSSTHWFTRDGKTAERAYPEGANIMPLRIRDLDQFDVWDMGGGAYTPEFMRQALKEAKKDGAKGVIFENVRDPGLGTTGRPKASTVVAVLDPKLLRSTAAEFDPTKINSANILAANPVPAAGIGVATQSRQPTYRTGGRF